MTDQSAQTDRRPLAPLLHEYGDVMVSASASIPWSAMPPEEELQWDADGLVLPDVYLVLRGPKARVDELVTALATADTNLWVLYEYSYTDAPTPERPRGAAPTSTTPCGAHTPGAGPVEEGTHGPTAPRGSVPHPAVEHPGRWWSERAATALALGQLLVAVALGAAVTLPLILLNWLVIR